MKFNAFPVKKFLVLFTILAFPCALYYFLREKGENRYKPLAIYGEKVLSGTFHTKRGKSIPDTTYHQIREFELLNQRSETVSFPSDSSQITIVNFFYTKCPAFCASMMDEMARVAETYKGNRLVRFLSISVDQEDTPAVLNEYYAKYLGINPKWDLLSGEQSLTHSISREDFMLDALPDSTVKGGIVHSSKFVLLDPSQRIRGYYDFSNGPEQTNIMIDEIKLLITEELRKVKIR